MTSDSDIRNVLVMLGMAAFNWGVESLGDGELDESGIFAKFGDDAWQVGERFVRRNVLGDDISRYIPQDVKVAVAVRDEGRCTGILSDGTRCPVTSSLHYDHKIIPFRLGGPQAVWNLTLLCKSHNWSKGGSIGGRN